MATISSKVFRHHKKTDGTYNVKICIYHKKERVYIDTPHYLTEKKLSSIFTIKDPLVTRLVNDKLEDYRETISRIGNKLDLLDVHELRNYLIQKDQPIDFICFCQLHIDSLVKNKQYKSASNYRTIRYSLIDYFNREVVSVEEITVNTLKGYEQYLRNERGITRINQFGKTVSIKPKRLSENSIHNYLRDFRGLYNGALNHYNNSQFDVIRIKHNPFENYKIVEPSITPKRNIEIHQIKKIRDCQVSSGSTAELARDLFVLSFYLCGMNAADLHACDYQIIDHRIEYNRSKTKEKRRDRAFISIKIIPEAEALLNRYRDLSKRYRTRENLNAALSKGMRQIAGLTDIPGVTYYWARHSFANLARKSCRKSKDDVALALNHVDQARKTTDIYLAKDWSIIDEVQEAVVTLLRDLDGVKTKFCFHLQKLIKSKFNNLKFTFRFIFGIYFNC
ncbi:MAG: hypothetical protein JWQ57_2906 [Mucilaginibacter sp.]|nr:hypothetical protein [Mucilaginibacter sp.]